MKFLYDIADWFESTWIGRPFKRLAIWRDEHPGWSLLFLPLDIILITILIVSPVLVIALLAGIVSWPAKWLGADDVGTLLFGLAVIITPAVLIIRHINRKRKS